MHPSGCGKLGLNVNFGRLAAEVNFDCSEPTSIGLPASTGNNQVWGYRGTSLIRNSPPLGPYRRTIPRASWWS